MADRMSSSIENYLEAILMVENKYKIVRVKDISQHMSVSTAGVHSALHTLENLGLINHQRYGYVELTKKGRSEAKRIYSLHKTLFEFLTKILNIGRKTAEKDACKIEHSISLQTSIKIARFIEFVKTCPDYDRPDWLKSFDHYFKTGKRLQCKIREIKLNTKTKK